MGSANSSHVAYDDLAMLNKLGEGAFGVVYKARKRRSGDYYAVKKMQLRTDEQVAMAVDEAKAVQRVSGHPNIVAFYDFAVDGLTACIVLEFCEEGNLNDYILREKPGNMKCAKFCKHMSLGLHHIHSMGIAHRDLKPDNILISKGVCKIGDLGVSKAMEQLWGSATYGMRLSQLYTYSAGGTPVYWAPEVIRRVRDQQGHISSRCDIFSLGLVFLVMFTKQTVYAGKRRLLVPILGDKSYGECEQGEIDRSVRRAGAPSNVTEGIVEMLQLDYQYRASTEHVVKFMEKCSCTIL